MSANNPANFDAECDCRHWDSYTNTMVSLRTFGPYNDPRHPELKFSTNFGELFQSEVVAELFCKMWNDYNRAMESIRWVPRSLNRADYERICANHGVEVLPDSECNSYGVKHGVFEPWLDGLRIAGYTIGHCIAMALALRRLRGIEAERVSAPKPHTNIMMTKCSCGQDVPSREVMSASLGTSCPDCYDRMSA